MRKNVQPVNRGLNELMNNVTHGGRSSDVRGADPHVKVSLNVVPVNMFLQRKGHDQLRRRRRQCWRRRRLCQGEPPLFTSAQESVLCLRILIPSSSRCGAASRASLCLRKTLCGSRYCRVNSACCRLFPARHSQGGDSTRTADSKGECASQQRVALKPPPFPLATAAAVAWIRLRSAGSERIFPPRRLLIQHLTNKLV